MSYGHKKRDEELSRVRDLVDERSILILEFILGRLSIGIKVASSFLLAFIASVVVGFLILLIRLAYEYADKILYTVTKSTEVLLYFESLSIDDLTHFFSIAGLVFAALGFFVSYFRK